MRKRNNKTSSGLLPIITGHLTGTGQQTPDTPHQTPEPARRQLHTNNSVVEAVIADDQSGGNTDG